MENILIRSGDAEDFKPFVSVCQRSAQAAYASEKDDVSAKLFSEYHFFHESSLEYFHTIAANDPHTRWLVAEDTKSHEIVGGISLKRRGQANEVYGYYVLPEYQGQGIGTALWQAMEKLDNLPLVIEVYSHVSKTIDLYRKLGFRATGKSRRIHWDSWPPDVYLTAEEYIRS